MKIIILVLLGGTLVNSEPKCTGEPRMLNGKMCASTARYSDYHRGACGCGPSGGDEQFDWNHAGFNMAANQFFFSSSMKGWCGEKCGKCYKLTTTGGFIDGFGDPVQAGESYTFMITNFCPDEWPFTKWCSQSSNNNNQNQYHYSAHFNLEDGRGQVRAIGWGDLNPEVTFEMVDCNSAHIKDNRTANDKMYLNCEC